MRTVVILSCVLLSSRVCADEPLQRSLSLAQGVAQQPRSESTEQPEASSRHAAARRDTTAPQQAGIGESSERRALAFIEAHQPKLLTLMSFLKRQQPNAYQHALKEIGRTQQRLEGLQKRDAELYAVELELWKIRSRLRLLAAEMSIAKDAERDALEGELKKLVNQESQQDLHRLQLMRERAAQQVIKFDAEITRRQNEREELAAKSLKSWRNRITKQSSSGRETK